MTAYSMDLRERVIAAYDRGDGSTRELAEVFGVSRAWISKLLRLRRERGSIAAVEYRRGPKPRLTDRHIDRICELLAAEPDLTLEEVRRRLRLPVSAPVLCTTLKRIGFTRKKSPSSQPSRPATTCSSREPASPVG